MTEREPYGTDIVTPTSPHAQEDVNDNAAGF